jgi:hypothetical protein
MKDIAGKRGGASQKKKCFQKNDKAIISAAFFVADGGGQRGRRGKAFIFNNIFS